MLCNYCGFEEVLEAIYCTDCGKPFYRVEWVEPYAYIDRNYKIDLSLRIVNQGSFSLILKKIKSSDDTIFYTFSDQGIIQGGSENVISISFTWYGSTSSENPLTNWVCECNLGGSRDIRLPLPKLFILASPDIKVFVNNVPLEENVSADENPRIPLRPSQGNQMVVNFQLLNDSITELLEYSLLSDDGTPIISNQRPQFRLSNGVLTNSKLITPKNYKNLTCAIILSKEQLNKLEENKKYEYRLAFRGKPNDVVLRFRPFRLLIPDVEILIKRPTNVGYAFVGKTAIDEMDISPRRLVEDAGLISLSPSQKKLLNEDFLVQDTFKELSNSNTPEIIWYVPKGKVRVKTIALIRTVSEDEEGKYDEISCQVNFVLRNKDIDLGRFILSEEKNRHEINLKLPALSKSEEGVLSIKYVGVTKKIEYKVSIHVLDAKPFPFPVAVDFGTTNSCISLSLPVRDNVGKEIFPPITPENTILIPIGNFNTENENIWIIPSMIEYREDGSFHIGNYRHNSVYTQFKLHINEESIRPLNDKGKEIKESPLKISADFLSEMLRRVMEYLEERRVVNCVVEKIVCPMPTTFSFNQRVKIREAYTMALKKLGIKQSNIKLRDIDESMAAFLYERRVGLEQKLERYKQKPILIMVYDFGGGTTDVTVNLTYFLKGQRNRKYLEIASGGNSQLGGEDITFSLADELFQGTTVEDIENAERIKKLLGTGYEFGKDAYLKEKLRIEDPKVIVHTLKNAFQKIYNWLTLKVQEILDDVLNKTCNRLSVIQKDIQTLDRPITLFVLLAGNATMFKNFDKLINSTLEKLISRNSHYQNWIKLEEVVKIDQPKSCVAKGAYFSKGHEPDIDRPYQPHHSYWMELPPDVIPLPNLPVILREGTKYLLLVEEGFTRPAKIRMNREEIGLNMGGDYTIYQKHGVNFIVYTNCELENPKPDEKELEIIISSDEIISLRWV